MADGRQRRRRPRVDGTGRNERGGQDIPIAYVTAARAFAELEDKGFVRMTKRGRWYGRLATTWAVTDRPPRGHPPTKRAWRNWKPKG